MDAQPVTSKRPPLRKLPKARFDKDGFPITIVLEGQLAFSFPEDGLPLR